MVLPTPSRLPARESMSFRFSWTFVVIAACASLFSWRMRRPYAIRTIRRLQGERPHLQIDDVTTEFFQVLREP